MEQNLNNKSIQNKELELLFKEISSQIKLNPNNFIIINKWNKRIYKKYQIKLFNAIEKEIELQLIKKFNNFFDNFTKI